MTLSSNQTDRWTLFRSPKFQLKKFILIIILQVPWLVNSCLTDLIVIWGRMSMVEL